MRRNPHTEAWLTLPRDHRGETDPASKAKEWLEDLVEHHLLQVAADGGVGRSVD
jgi:hypothetical protein